MFRQLQSKTMSKGKYRIAETVCHSCGRVHPCIEIKVLEHAEEKFYLCPHCLKTLIDTLEDAQETLQFFFNWGV